ncbi:UDP-galactopyranose mutase [Synoicihabitans lomoniglobus]|uniref:UDP-galactopyranose mutase n=1 Tax=Synoicihabitans lomoniglobus TaxID=2909285 RepID=A0AAF0CSV8_9BACT|nr:UDP-galactopyranose mutase [Opitutaceae bacterium LMO-M01]WED67376.1 UDP-galactopyranose mutase [Opitutaceae bacterium LMO-M01]
MPEYNFLIVGAGFSGAVIARHLATHTNARIEVIDSRDHIGGNCHTARDAATGVMVHTYGPHIFNTRRDDVWNYVNQFAEFGPYTNRVKAHTPQGVFGLPINLLTINQFFGQTFSPAEARAHLASLGDHSIEEPQNFEEQALKFLGRKLYENFFRGYTIKQWGCDPKELPASILKRLPVRFNYDDSYFDCVHQGIPREGYTALIERILDAPRITVNLSRPFDPAERTKYEHVFYTGPIDAFFEHRYGRLGYRTVTFERVDATGDFQGNAVINYTDAKVPYSRVHEHKHFAPWESHEHTVAFQEYSKETQSGDIPYYPKRLKADVELLQRYVELAMQERAVSFVGRLGTYRYLNMDQVIGESLDFAHQAVDALAHGKRVPVFSTAPISSS